jgi:phenylpropionate dioxygenase-like ring-hydroxylating dioxygenase large terminal subunit
MTAALGAAQRAQPDAPAERRPLPAWAYGSAELLALEVDRIFRRSWLLACHLSDLPEPGSYFVFDLDRDSVLLLRGEDGEIRAFRNHCRHRAARLLDGSGKCRKRLACPYHGWSYDLTGRLRAIPRAGGFAGPDHGALGLHPVALEQLAGFVFVRLLGDGASVAEMWGPLAQRLEPYRTAELRPLEPIRTEIWACNWKVAFDNYLESYHVPVAHPGFNRLAVGDGGEMRDSGVGRGGFRLRPRRSAEPDEARYQELSARSAGHLPPALRQYWDQYSMLPNLGLDLYPECVDFFQVLPLDERRTLVRAGVYALPDDDPEMAELRRLNLSINAAVNAEDRELCRRVQAGLDSYGYEPGPLSEEECGVLQFHDHLRRRIPPTSLPQAPEPGSLRRLAEAMA